LNIDKPISNDNKYYKIIFLAGAVCRKICRNSRVNIAGI